MEKVERYIELSIYREEEVLLASRSKIRLGASRTETIDGTPVKVVSAIEI